MDNFLGQILMVGFNFAPNGWMLCQGQILSISQNTALFSLLGTFYGGDGITTFALPDLRGRVPVGQGQGLGLPYFVMGQVGGSATTQILNNNLPPLLLPNGLPQLAAASSDAASGIKVTPSALVGEQQPINIMQPYLCLNFVIAVNGIYPSRW